MEKQGLNEDDAYQTLRRQAMGKRVPMEENGNRHHQR